MHAHLKTNRQSLLKAKVEPPNNNENIEAFDDAKAKKLRGRPG
jgi:hypothetical protein